MIITFILIFCMVTVRTVMMYLDINFPTLKISLFHFWLQFRNRVIFTQISMERSHDGCSNHKPRTTHDSHTHINLERHHNGQSNGYSEICTISIESWQWQTIVLIACPSLSSTLLLHLYSKCVTGTTIWCFKLPVWNIVAVRYGFVNTIAIWNIIETWKVAVEIW